MLRLGPGPSLPEATTIGQGVSALEGEGGGEGKYKATSISDHMNSDHHILFRGWVTGNTGTLVSQRQRAISLSRARPGYTKSREVDWTQPNGTL